MTFTSDPVQTLEESLNEMVQERVRNNEYYHSPEYQGNRDKSLAISRKIRKRIGKKKMKEIWDDCFDSEQLEGELHSGLSESCYRLGFMDALRLSQQLHEIERARPGVFDAVVDVLANIK